MFVKLSFDCNLYGEIMKTVDNLNITSLSIRNKSEVMGETKNCNRRVVVHLPKHMNDRLQEISNEMNVNVTEIIRQAINSLLINCKDLIDENNY